MTNLPMFYDDLEEQDIVYIQVAYLLAENNDK